MIERGYYKHYKGDYYYVICEAILTNDNNTQERYIVYKPIESDTIFIKLIKEFEGFIQTEDGETLKRFKKVSENIPTVPYTVTYPSPYLNVLSVLLPQQTGIFSNI